MKQPNIGLIKPATKQELIHHEIDKQMQGFVISGIPGDKAEWNITDGTFWNFHNNKPN